MKKLFFIITSIVIFSSCAFHNGHMTDSASLSTNNFKYAKTQIQGSEKSTHVLGIGGLGKQALVDEAKRNMLFGNELQPNQALANISVNWKTSFFIVFSTTKCTVTADIVEFNSIDNSPLGASTNSSN